MIKTVPKGIDLYFECLHCGTKYKWPGNKARKYCNRSCSDAAYYRRKNGSSLQESVLWKIPSEI